jgi:hypothetical protein
MRRGRDDASGGVKSVPSGLSWPLAAVMPVTLRSCSVPGQEGWPKPSAQFDPAWPAKFRRHSRPATSEKGHSRRLGHVGDMSGLPQAPDISGPGRHFAFVPLTEIAPPHSITSSARASSIDGILMPRAFAVVRLINRLNLVGCSKGSSPGAAPLRILCSRRATPWKASFGSRE